MRKTPNVAPVEGKLGVLTPGMGAVTTTFIAGVESVKKALALPIGSLTQMGHVRLGKRTDERNPLIRELVPLATKVVVLTIETVGASSRAQNT